MRDDFLIDQPLAGSLMSFSDKIFDPTTFGNFPELAVDWVPHDWSLPISTDDASIQSTDSSTVWNLYMCEPALLVTIISATPHLVGLDIHCSAMITTGGEFLDSGESLPRPIASGECVSN